MLALVTILAVALVPVGSYVALALAWVALTIGSLVARLGPWRLMRGGLVAVPFLLAALPVVFTRGGELLGRVEIGPVDLAVSRDGLVLFTTIALKSWLSVQAALLLAYTTPFHELLDALRELRVPRILVAIVGFMYRYLAVLGGEAARLQRARAARSAVPAGAAGGGSLRWRAGVTGSMVGTLFLRSYERSERVYAAMQARGFEGTFRHMGVRPVRTAEWAALAAVLVGVAAWELAAHVWLPRW